MHSTQGVCVASAARCVIKILKPVKKKKIRREIKILQVWRDAMGEDAPRARSLVLRLRCLCGVG
jgi:hypothetical protein